MKIQPDIITRMVALRRHLHQYPELSGQEFETQAYLLQQIVAEGITGAQVAADTGIVVDIIGNVPGSNRCVAVRADIDALPITEDTGLEFASVRPGIMHACGHDVHTAMVFGAMLALHRRRDFFSGSVRFIFQPAEEAAPTGAPRIIAEGWLDSVDSAIGLHVDPYLDSGLIAVGAGPYTLACDDFDLVIHAAQTHAAKPHEGIDGISVGCSVVNELQRLVSRETGPFDPLVLSITKFNAGRSYNILPSTVEIGGTLRSGCPESRIRGQRRLAEIAQGVAAVHGAQAELRMVPGEPPVINDPGMVDMFRDAITNALGSGVLVNAPGWEAADDFGFFSEKVPSVYYRLGVRQVGVEAFPLHHPKMMIDEAAMTIGLQSITAAAVVALSGEG
ncbi:MAG: M20 family metallopeptidase [Paracoccus sp. (in: a-proteobacteria)]|uniref:M20 metallopeptidase family protein n=1 Tax=Paracoccus sp. TaxID=267 RepID=UPI0026DF900E|nr:M20 family metallopeptidase [Paracoccus sp. (in: a-proteobacteria)]MDO5632140.1 M20 family metallopeptidase [Paracoccus sp. (in: a-proteobacteria)]